MQGFIFLGPDAADTGLHFSGPRRPGYSALFSGPRRPQIQGFIFRAQFINIQYIQGLISGVQLIEFHIVERKRNLCSVDGGLDFLIPWRPYCICYFYSFSRWFCFALKQNKLSWTHSKFADFQMRLDGSGHCPCGLVGERMKITREAMIDNWDE